MSLENISTGLLPNDGTGDSIRVAFLKTNNNFAYLGASVNNLATGNLSATGNIVLNATSASYWTGSFFLNGSQLATVNNLFGGGTVANPTYFTSNVDAIDTVTGAVQITGGLAVQANAWIGNLHSYGGSFTGPISSPSVSGTFASFTAATGTGDLTTTGFNITTGNISGANVTASLQVTALRAVIREGGLTVSNIIMTGSMSAATTSNIIAGNLNAYNTVAATSLTGTVQTVSQPNITFVGNLITANVTGNLIAGNITSKIGQFSNLTVTDIPTVNSVTTKSYVVATVVGFAIGLGS